MYFFNDSLCVDDLKLKFYDVVVTANADFCVSGLTVVCFHDSYSSFYMITIRRLSFENDNVQYRVELNSSSSSSRVRVRARVEFELKLESSLSSSSISSRVRVLRFRVRFEFHFSS